MTDSSTDEESVPSSIKVETQASINPVEMRPKSTLLDKPVTITVTNDDSDSNTSPREITTNKKPSKLSKFLHKANKSTDKVVLMENGENCASSFGLINQGFLHGESSGFFKNQTTKLTEDSSVSLDDESSNKGSAAKKKSKLHLPHFTQSHKSPTTQNKTARMAAASLLKEDGSDDVTLTMSGDIELEDMDQPAAVHSTCRKYSSENAV